MFAGHIQHTSDEFYSATLQRVLAYLRETDFLALAAGKYPLGNDIIANVMDIDTQQMSWLHLKFTIATSTCTSYVTVMNHKRLWRITAPTRSPKIDWRITTFCFTPLVPTNRLSA